MNKKIKKYLFGINATKLNLVNMSKMEWFNPICSKTDCKWHSINLLACNLIVYCDVIIVWSKYSVKYFSLSIIIIGILF